MEPIGNRQSAPQTKTQNYILKFFDIPAQQKYSTYVTNIWLHLGLLFYFEYSSKLHIFALNRILQMEMVAQLLGHESILRQRRDDRKP